MNKKYIATTGNPLASTIPIPCEQNYSPSAPLQPQSQLQPHVRVVQPFEVIVCDNDVHGVHQYNVIEENDSNTYSNIESQMNQAEISGLKMVRDEHIGNIIANQRAAQSAASIEASVTDGQGPDFYIPNDTNPHTDIYNEKRNEFESNTNTHTKINIPNEYVSSNEYKPDGAIVDTGGRGEYVCSEYKVNDYETSDYKSVYE